MSPAENDNRPKAVPEMAEDGERPLSPAARRALEEAEARRQAEKASAMPAEFGGRGGADPSRFGAWEINGRAIDF